MSQVHSRKILDRQKELKKQTWRTSPTARCVLEM